MNLQPFTAVIHGGNNMICTNCGTQFEDGAFCPNCGTPAAAAPAPAPAPAPQAAPQYNYAPQPQPVYSAAPAGAAAGDPEQEKSCLITGILAAAFSCTFFLSFLGIVFGPMGLNKAKTYLNTYGTYPVKVRIGKYLSIGGLAMGIFMTVYFAIYFTAFLVGLANGLR